MCRMAVFAVFAVVAAACGGSPSAPGPTTTVPLSSGPYRLIVHLGMGVQSCDGQFCSSILLCAGGLGAGTPVAVPVFLNRTGDQATVRQNDSRSTLVMTLQISGSTVTGTITGRGFDSAGTVVEVRGADNQPASLTGGPTDRGAVMGMLNGRVTIGGSSCSGDQSMWRLEPAR